MPFLVQTLNKHSIILTTIRAPIIRGEASRAYRAMDDKISNRAENDTIHIVLDVSSFDYNNRLSVERYIKLMSKLYEDWHYKRSIVLWFAVDTSYYDMAKYLAQTRCLPIYLRTSLFDVFQEIDTTYGETATLHSEESQIFE